jgi:hypothetical protein
MATLTDQHRAALEAFAAAHKHKRDRSPGCANWREELCHIYWYNARIWSGGAPGMGTTLHEIRNTFGPSWLFDECPIR